MGNLRAPSGTALADCRLVWLKPALPADSGRTAKLNLSMWFAKGAKLEQPVTVCLRTGAVKPCTIKGSGMVEDPGLTAPDWPVVVTDASVLEGTVPL